MAKGDSPSPSCGGLPSQPIRITTNQKFLLLGIVLSALRGLVFGKCDEGRANPRTPFAVEVELREDSNAGDESQSRGEADGPRAIPADSDSLDETVAEPENVARNEGQISCERERRSISPTEILAELRDASHRERDDSHYDREYAPEGFLRGECVARDNADKHREDEQCELKIYSNGDAGGLLKIIRKELPERTARKKDAH